MSSVYRFELKQSRLVEYNKEIYLPNMMMYQ